MKVNILSSQRKKDEEKKTKGNKLMHEPWPKINKKALT